MAATVAIMMVIHKLSWPLKTRYPEKGRITSLGMGNELDSRIINPKMPGYPHKDTVFFMLLVKEIIVLTKGPLVRDESSTKMSSKNSNET